MDYQQEYRNKLTTPEEAVKCIKSGDWVDYGVSAIHPKALDRALAARSEELFDVKIRGMNALWLPEIAKVPDAPKHFTWHSWAIMGDERKMQKMGMCYYIPLRYSELPRLYRENLAPCAVAMFQVTPMDKNGNFNFGPSCSHLAAVVTELLAKPFNDVDCAVAKNVVSLLHGGECLQLGIGAMPNAVGSLIAQSDLKDFGVNSEMYVDGFVDLALAGKITGKYKNIDRGRQVFSFAAGSRKLYEYLDNNRECMTAPIDYVNDIRTISSIDHFAFICGAIEVDLYGQVSAESSGFRQISGAGGQQDFVLGAYLSKGGRSFICCSSTYTDKNGVPHSRIVPHLPDGTAVTEARPNTMYVVTEYGAVNLKGMSTWERAEALIGIANPIFYDELVRHAEKQGIWRKINR
ncbi:acetyl-CoA hydrolase/transferase C-terminal domain-containing protein [uncultured Dialister sp.]|uniref:acetyl-CoA hydrolase/transferase C-terminal domain-containing protein n=1 Tax=uncultured Dialister sp. TaxID=278064 RepID=UPI0025FAC75E|nr:acetyl-CoA hydrolase/transferase C-terminal domain-containing protein [uncultured Dialister sp.]